MALSTTDLLYKMHQDRCIKKINFDVMAIDELPLCVEQKPFAIIVNLDKRRKPGSHWIAIYLAANHVSYYFDSLGYQPIKKEIIFFLTRNSKNGISVHSDRIQQFDSNVCGYYSLLFLQVLCRKNSPCSFLKLFSVNKNDNDKQVHHFVNILLNE